VHVVTEWTRAAGGESTVAADLTLGDADVAVIDATSGAPRPGGPRFGTLVHATLATVALDADAAQVADAVDLQARILGAPAEEIAAATVLVGAALAHPLIARARDAARAGRCRRETPVSSREADGSLVEGALDLAFEDADGWTVVDFKTDAEIGAELPRYRRQVSIYASVVAKATGKNVSAILLRL